MTQPSHKQDVETRAEGLVEPLVRAEGLELVELEFLKEHEGWVLRLFIDRPGHDPSKKEGGVGLEECSRVSHAVETALEVEGFIDHAYHLEVSSPGLNRPLKKVEHFERVKGKQIRVKTFAPLGDPPRRNFLGALVEVTPESVSVEIEGAGQYRIPLRDIAKANLEFEF
jgi:ribosome maturation factor RimP